MKKLIAALGAIVLCGSAIADHSWGNYHWARTTSSFDLVIINSTTSTWDPYVAVAVGDWSQSGVLNMIEDPNGDTASKTRRRCKGGTGTVRICNLAYGNTGWLGIAGISLDANNHITTGYTKLNDTYYGSGSYYDTPAWRQSVTCQELGHNVGLGHQDEDFNQASSTSCMEYQDPPFAAPDGHDYDQLDTIYRHTDSYDSYAGSGGSGGGGGGGDGGGNDGCKAPPGVGCNKARPTSNADIGWGMSLGRRGQQETFMRIDPDGTRHVTFVTWAKGH